MKKLIINAITFLLIQLSFGQYEITGKLANYDKLWHNKVYLAIVEPGTPYSSISDKQIINVSTLDVDGNFTLKGSNLHETPSILRLYLVNRAETDTYLSVEERNFLLLILDNQSKTYIEARDFSQNPLNYSITGDFSEQNQKIQELELACQNLILENESNPYARSGKGEKLLQEKKVKLIQDFSIATKYPMVSLLSLQKINLEANYEQHKDFYQRLLQQLKNHENQNALPYVKAFENSLKVLEYKSQIPKEKNSSFPYTTILIVVLSVTIILLALYIKSLKKQIKTLSKEVDTSSLAHQKECLATLTTREKEILELLIQDYRNKEIAVALHLEISTIKTHLSKLYKKLGIENRTQAKQFQSALKKED